MSTPVIGPLNIAYLFALSQFLVAWIIAFAYMRAAGKFDAMAKSVLAHLTNHKNTESGDTVDVDTLGHVFVIHCRYSCHYLLGRPPFGGTAFFAAGRRITGWQNGIAVAGDYMSAASFLGIAGIIAFQGYDGFMYSVGWLVAYLDRAPGGRRAAA